MTLQMAYDEKYKEGITQEKEDTARRMLSDGTLTLEQISSFTGLSSEQILSLKKSISQK